ncbi:MAG TPA: LysR substrate-binding domain-containing protein [Pseudomonas sp.]|uniref:LysR substrate-binding domain-containing protein n=1 Tax=Pseudomonas sp. TaxID=306 RepID=UPI002ED7BBB6
MRLTLRQVEAFRAVMRTGSMTGGADLMAVTQPAVTRLVRDMEAALGYALFERRGNQLQPTSYAIALIPEIERSFIGLERIARVARGIGEQTAGSLRIAAMPAVANTLLPAFLARFLTSRPQLHVSLLGVPSHLVAEMVASGEADIGYAEGPLNRHGLNIQAVPMHAVVVVPDNHRLAGLAVVDPLDLSGECMIAVAPGSLFAAGVTLALAEVPRLARFETGLSYTACALVAQGLGVSIVDPPTAQQFTGRGVVIKPLSVSVDTGFLVIRSENALAQELVEVFAEEFLAFACEG